MNVTMNELDSELAKVKSEQKTLHNEVRQLRKKINPALDVEENIIEKKAKKSSLEFTQSNRELTAKFELKENRYNDNKKSIVEKKEAIETLKKQISELEELQKHPPVREQPNLPLKDEKENGFFKFMKKVVKKLRGEKMQAQKDPEIDWLQVQQAEIDISDKKSEIESMEKSIDSLKKENEDIKQMRVERAARLEQENKEIQNKLQEIESQIQQLNKEKNTILANAPKLSKEQRKQIEAEISEKTREMDKNRNKIRKIENMQKELDPSKYVLSGILPADIFPGGEVKNTDEMMQKAAERMQMPKKESMEISDEEYQSIFGDKTPENDSFRSDLQGMVEPDDKIDREERKPTEELQKDEQEKSL